MAALKQKLSSAEQIRKAD